MTGRIVSARRTADGIMLHRIVPSEVEGEVTMRLIEVLPDDADWLEAVAALPPDDVAPIEPAPPALEALKAQAVWGINQVVGEVRKRYITPILGQEALYVKKEQQAREWVAAEAPQIEDYKMIAREVGVTAPTADELAQIWLNMAAITEEAVSRLENIRMTAIYAIRSAAGAADVEAAKAAAFATIAGLNELTSEVTE
uniref:Uncharacterized protein n=1 Tax=Cereibacter sphaeroides (strain ATCC 17025 / ATH 2.4.3) TaxID=349102 RepID=A4WS53_CERS5